VDLVTLTVGLPFAPLRGLLAVARVLQEEAERQMYDPSAARRELEELEELQSGRTIEGEVVDDAQQAVLDRLLRCGSEG
jgi:hypothetical protein